MNNVFNAIKCLRTFSQDFEKIMLAGGSESDMVEVEVTAEMTREEVAGRILRL